MYNLYDIKFISRNIFFLTGKCRLKFTPDHWQFHRLEFPSQLYLYCVTNWPMRWRNFQPTLSDFEPANLNLQLLTTCIKNMFIRLFSPCLLLSPWNPTKFCGRDLGLSAKLGCSRFKLRKNDHLYLIENIFSPLMQLY